MIINLKGKKGEKQTNCLYDNKKSPNQTIEYTFGKKRLKCKIDIEGQDDFQQLF